MRKRIINRSFSKQASIYDRQAVLQRESSERLVELLPDDIAGRQVLEIGSGSGFLTGQLIVRDSNLITCDLAHGMNRFLQDKLRTRFPNTQVPILTADAEHLPFGSERFDMVTSNLCFQWVDELTKVFNEVMRVLTPGGCFVFSVFGEKTLHELRAAFSQAAIYLQRTDHTQQFPSLTDIKEGLRSAGFIDFKIDRKRCEKKYHDLSALLRSLKTIGSVNASDSRPQGLGQRRLLQQAEAFYRRSNSRHGQLQATYDIYYVRARAEPAE